jgi:cytoskeletal protein CcmA (bactofilin family)
MWNKTNLEAQPKPSPPSDAPASVPTSSFRVEPAMPGTAIGKAMTIVGEIYSEEDLFMDGQVRGTVELKDSRLTVGPNGRADSNVKAREVVILGQVRGDVEASQKITIRKQGSMIGNIRTTGIVIDDDAYFKGSIDIVRKPAAE